ncbi:ATP-dependent DNA helicase Q 1 [Spatholobus suberectus]|nr:ATP-dependent DNA helicase Q 1 [Spatholobus suberectus]
MGYGSGQRRVEIVSGKSYGCSKSYVAAIPSEVTRASHNGATTVAKPWSFGDPETKRRKRIAKYKVYAVEGKVKASLRNGIRWIKHTCSRIVHGY